MFAMGDSTSIGVGQSRSLVRYYLNSVSSNIVSKIQSNTAVFVYSNIIFKDDSEQTIENFLTGEITTTKERGERVFSKMDLPTKMGNHAVVKQFLDEKHHQYFAIAYIDEPRHIVMITFSTQTTSQFQTYYSNFEKIVKSYEKSVIGMEQ
jgi:hypothetical protein